MTRYCFIIGAMKAGTSTLFDFLAAAPGVNPSSAKEPEFFSAQQPHSLNIQKFESLFSDKMPQDALRLEASTGYTKPGEDGVADRIHAFTPDPKFIFLARDPIRRIESHYNFVNGIRAPLNSLDPLAPRFVDTTRYGKMLQPFLETFSRESILVLRFEDLFAPNNAQCIDRISCHLNITLPEGPHTFAKRNSAEGLHSRHVRWVTRRLPTGLRRALPKSLFSPLLHMASRATQGSNLPRRLSETEVARVWDILDDDLTQFSRTYDVPLEGWRRPATLN